MVRSTYDGTSPDSPVGVVPLCSKQIQHKDNLMFLSLKLFKRVNGFTFNVDWEMDNELAVLFGSSGAGKSMTLNVLAGLLEIDHGFIQLDRDIIFDSYSGINIRPQKRAIGYVFQDLALFPYMTVRKNILYGASYLQKDEQKNKVQEITGIFHLQGLEDRLPAEISGGQRQRVALARVLAGKPRLLLLDEPFSALDAPLRLEMRRLIKELRVKFNIPVILVTHDLAEACYLADRLIIYSGGKIVQTGSPASIFNNPACPEVEALLSPASKYRMPGVVVDHNRQ